MLRRKNFEGKRVLKDYEDEVVKRNFKNDVL